MMKNKIVTIAFLFVLLSTAIPNVIGYRLLEKSDDNNIQTGLHDFVGSIELFEEDGQTWYNYSITNIGDAAADHFNVTVTVYPFGTFLLRNNIWLFLQDH